MPNWSRFQSKVSKMINTDLGNETINVSTPSVMSYNFETGEYETTPVVVSLKAVLIPTNKDDLKDLPEGARERTVRKLFTTVKIEKTATITTTFDNEKYEVMVPSAAYTAGGLVHCYRTFIAKIENISTPYTPPNNEDDE